MADLSHPGSVGLEDTPLDDLRDGRGIMCVFDGLFMSNFKKFPVSSPDDAVDRDKWHGHPWRRHILSSEFCKVLPLIQSMAKEAKRAASAPL